MSMPAGWYDDGSGRQRWWDGARWTDHVAPGVAVPAAVAAGPVQPGPPPSAARVRRNASALGIFGLGLAGFGTVIGSLESSYIVGIIALIVGFVMSLVGLFMRNTSKWPSVAGLLLSILGAAFATVVVFGIGFLSDVDAAAPTGWPSPSPSVQPVTPTTEASSERPEPQLIGDAILKDLQRSGHNEYDDNPAFITCMGQYFYDSEISDEALTQYVDSLDLPEAEADVMENVSRAGTVFCTTG